VTAPLSYQSVDSRKEKSGTEMRSVWLLLGSLPSLLLMACKGQNTADDYFFAGVELQKKGLMEEGLAKYDEAIRLDPSHARAFGNRASTYNHLGQPERVLQDFGEAIRLDPDTSGFYGNRGQLFLNVGQTEQAIDDFNQAIKLSPEDAIAHYNRGFTHELLGQPERAMH
jgi:tetratricopeptide (TPR) repeat protein